MSLTYTRPEAELAMIELVGMLRNTIADRARTGEINIAEAVTVLAQTLASILTGAYDKKNREIALMAFPDVVKAYYPQWEMIYAAHKHTPAMTTPNRTDAK